MREDDFFFRSVVVLIGGCSLFNTKKKIQAFGLIFFIHSRHSGSLNKKSEFALQWSSPWCFTMDRPPPPLSKTKKKKKNMTLERRGNTAPKTPGIRKTQWTPFIPEETPHPLVFLSG